MKLKKILFLIVIFFAVLVPISNADTDEVNLDFSKIADRFNKCYYTSALSSIGVSVKATKVDDSFVLTYNNSESITYSYNKSSGTFSTTYPITNDTEKDILSALFVDAISTLEGNEEGSQALPVRFRRSRRRGQHRHGRRETRQAYGCGCHHRLPPHQEIYAR